MQKRYIKNITTFLMLSFTFLFAFSAINANKKTMQTSSSSLVSNKKIEWGIKRGKNHQQPDLGSENKRIIDKYEGISMGNSEKPYIY